MLSNAYTTNITSTTQTTKVQATADASNVKVAGVRISPEQMASRVVKLIVTTSAEFPPNLPCPWPFATTLSSDRTCDVEMIDDSMGSQIEQICSLTPNGHLHSTKKVIDVFVEEDPIPLGAKQNTKTLEYIHPHSLPFILGYAPALLTSSSDFETSAPQCKNLHMETKTGQSMPVECVVRSNHHIHTWKKHIYLRFLPPEQMSIPYGAYSVTRHTAYAPISKEVRPRLWDCLPTPLQERYLSDVVDCYLRGETCSVIGTRHGISPAHVRSLLRMSGTVVIRTGIEETQLAVELRKCTSRPQLRDLEELNLLPLKKVFDQITQAQKEEQAKAKANLHQYEKQN